MSKLKRFSGFAYLLPAIPTILIGALFWLRILTLDGDGGAYYVLKWSTIYWTIAALAMFLVSALAMRLKQKGIIFVICGSFWLGLSIWVSQTAGFRPHIEFGGGQSGLYSTMNLLLSLYPTTIKVFVSLFFAMCWGALSSRSINNFIFIDLWK